MTLYDAYDFQRLPSLETLEGLTHSLYTENFEWMTRWIDESNKGRTKENKVCLPS